MTNTTLTLSLPFTSIGWNDYFEVYEYVGGNWIDKGGFSGRDALDRHIEDKFFDGRQVAVFHKDEMVWTNFKKA